MQLRHAPCHPILHKLQRLWDYPSWTDVRLFDPGTAVRLETRGYGAGDRIRTGDINLGKVALYQLSYSRTLPEKQHIIVAPPGSIVKSAALSLIRQPKVHIAHQKRCSLRNVVTDYKLYGCKYMKINDFKNNKI